MQADTVEAAEWWARPRQATAATWISNYQRSLNARHRDLIVEQVKRVGAETLFEVGCHCGPNLVRLAQECPELKMLGVDVNAEAVQAGRAWTQALGFGSRIQLNAGRLNEAIARLPSKSCDVVLSCFTLAYTAPGDLDAVLYELGRIAARAVILAEPMALGPGSPSTNRSITGYSEWAHDYRAAKEWVGTWRDRTIEIIRVEPPVDHLNAILVAASDGILMSSTP